MKKNVFAVLILLLSVKGFTQTTILLSNDGTASTLAANEVILVSVEPETNAKVTIDIKNTGNTTQTYNAKRYDVLLNSDATSTAQAYFCIAGSCYGPPTIVSPTPLTLNSMQSASQLQGPYQMLVADLDEASTKGVSLVKYTFQNVNNPNDSVQISIKYNSTGTTTGILNTQNNEPSWTVSPVPAKGYLNCQIEPKSRGEGTLKIYDISGKVSFKKTIILEKGVNNIPIDISSFVPGLYYSVLSTSDGKSAKKIVVE